MSEEHEENLGRFIREVIDQGPPKGQPPLEELSDGEIASREQAAERAPISGSGVGGAFFMGDAGEEVTLEVSKRPGEPLNVEEVWVKRTEQFEDEVAQLERKLQEDQEDELEG